MPSGQVAKNARRPWLSLLCLPAVTPQPKFHLEDDGGVTRDSDKELKMVRLIKFMNELLRILRMMRMTLQRKGCSKAALVKAHTRARLLTESQRKLCKENPGPALLFHLTLT